MKLNPKYKIEKAVADDTKPALNYVHISEDKKFLVATNGKILAKVPADMEDTDDRGNAAIPPEVIKAMRKQAKRSQYSVVGLNGSFQFVDGSTLPRPTSEAVGIFPQYEQIIPKDPVIKYTVSFDPMLLLDLAEALGTPNNVTLEIQEANGPAIIVRNDEAYGLIMPLKVK